VLIYAKF